MDKILATGKDNQVLTSSHKTRGAQARGKRGFEEDIPGKTVASTPAPGTSPDYAPGAGAEDFPGQFLAFMIADQRFALSLDQVDRVLRMVALIPVPEAPEVIAGLINLHGQVVPVISLNTRLGLSRRVVDVNDRILVVKTGDRILGLIVDSVQAVLTVSADQVEKPRGSLVKAPLLQSLFRKDDEVYLVLSVDHFDPEGFNPAHERLHGACAKK